jgi:hypothetical protein
VTDVSTTQSSLIQPVVATTTDYLKQISDALNVATHAGDDANVQALLPRFQDAIDLKAAAVNLQTIATLENLGPAVAGLKATVATLNAQKLQIDRIVNAIGTVATVISTINQIAGAVAKLAAAV